MRDCCFKNYILKLRDAVYTAARLKYIRKKQKLRIMHTKNTIAYIKRHKCSIARYGDGEFQLMLQADGPRFQKGSAELAEALSNVLDNHSPSLLICMPGPMISSKGLRKTGKQYWDYWALNNQACIVPMILKRTGATYCFGDSYISRPYTAYKSDRYTQRIFYLLKAIWKNRDILIVEGEKTRLGIRNDLFANVKSAKRILCPAENAFDSYEQILQTVLTCWNGELVILALGPTATILASDLSKRGIQALDLGHVDIQYEWFLAGDKSFSPVYGKYTNEAIGGRQVGLCDDKNYLSQIIAEIKKS